MSDNDTTTADIDTAADAWERITSRRRFIMSDFDPDDRHHVRWVMEKNGIREQRARACLREYEQEQCTDRDRDAVKQRAADCVREVEADREDDG